MTQIINFYAGPSAGKTTLSSGLFAYMKQKRINCEFANEFAKELVWEEHSLDNQIQMLKLMGSCMKPVLIVDNKTVVTVVMDQKGQVQSMRMMTLYNGAIDGISAMILACAVAGIDIETPQFKEAIDTAVNGAFNSLEHDDGSFFSISSSLH